jgi:serine/threonine-protein kinase
VIRTLGRRYILLEQVGTGGMAAVYRGHDSALDREVAVKLLHPHLASRPESRARFSREARAVARLSHPSIVEIYDFSGDGEGESFLVTEFIHGQTLRAFQADVGFGYPEVALLVGRALADALAHAHAAGVIHRDLKPENVLVQQGDPPALKLADFGIARILASDERLTMTGALVGSPHHMAPEIVEGREADARSDLFSLGTLLYWLVTGRLPFAAPNPTAILRRLLEGQYEDPRAVEPRVPDALAALLARLLSVDPAARPSTAAEVRDALDAILAEVGIAHPEQELGAFLRDPGRFKVDFLPRAVSALRAQAEAFVDQRRPARAVAAFARILALAPEDAEARRRLDALTDRARRRLLLLALGGAAAVLALVVATSLLILRRPPPAPLTETAPPAEAIASTGSAPESIASAPAPALPGATEREPRQPRSPAPPPAPGARTGPAASLSIHVRPYAQRALLDNVEVASGVQVVRFVVTPDHPHLIQIEHPCCFPFVKPVTAEEAARMGELRVPLEPRPARLRVEGPAATRVLIDGKLLGTAGESQRTPIEVALPRGESPYEGSVLVELVPPGAPPRAVSIKLKAGADVVVAVPQEERTP